MNFISKLKRKLKQYRRVISISRKPNRDEFISTLKISGLGVVLIGAVGFLIQLVYQFIIRSLL
ncbi:protein translocase SEC61 complex subunit gamma [archaeon]|nr:protein translocase SEC61 complex subunit gamma [archaeon]